MVQNKTPILLAFSCQLSAFSFKEKIKPLSSAVAITLQLSRLWRDRRNHEIMKIMKTNNWTQVLHAEHADT